MSTENTNKITAILPVAVGQDVVVIEPDAEFGLPMALPNGQLAVYQMTGKQLAAPAIAELRKYIRDGVRSHIDSVVSARRAEKAAENRERNDSAATAKKSK